VDAALGDVHCDVYGDVHCDVYGDVYGDVHCDVYCDVHGDVHGDVYCDVGPHGAVGPHAHAHGAHRHAASVSTTRRPHAPRSVEVPSP